MYIKLTHVLVKRKLAKTVGKDSGGKSRGLYCDYRQKDNHIQMEGGEIMLLLFNVYQAVHGNTFLYFH